VLDIFFLTVYVSLFTMAFLEAVNSEEESIIDKDGDYLVKYKVSKVETIEPIKHTPKKRKPKKPKKEKKKEAEPEPDVDADFLEDCIFALTSLGVNKKDAKKAAYEILSEGKIETVEGVLREVFKRK